MSESVINPFVGLIPKNSTVLVTGATGYTGSVLVRKLVIAGLDVRAIARESSNLEHLADLPISWFRGDVYDEAVLKAACAGVEYVFHVAALYRQVGVTLDEFQKVHVLSTKLLVEYVSLSPNFKRFVHVSTVGVHGHIENPPADENAPFAPGDDYQKTKLEGELLLRKLCVEKSIPFAVVRPAAIMGPKDTRLLKVFKMCKWPVFPIIGNGKCLYHLIHVQDLTDIMIVAAAHPKAAGEVFIGGNTEAIPLAEFAKIVGSFLGKKLRLIRIPAAPIFFAANVCEKLCSLFGVEPPLHKRRVAFYTKDRSFNTSKLQHLLGFTPRYSNKDGILDTAKWYVDNKWL